MNTDGGLRPAALQVLTGDVIGCETGFGIVVG